MRRFAEEQRREDERDGRRLLSIACQPGPALLSHQQLVVADVEAPPPSPDAYVDMGPVDPSHYQGLWELRRDLQQEHQDEEEDEPQPFLMELVSALTYVLLCFAHMLLSECARCFSRGKSFRMEREKKCKREISASASFGS